MEAKYVTPAILNHKENLISFQMWPRCPQAPVAGGLREVGKVITLLERQLGNLPRGQWGQCSGYKTASWSVHLLPWASAITASNLLSALALQHCGRGAISRRSSASVLHTVLLELIPLS